MATDNLFFLELLDLFLSVKNQLHNDTLSSILVSFDYNHSLKKHLQFQN